MHLYADFDGIRDRVIPSINDELHMVDALSDSLNSLYQMCVVGLDPRSDQVAQLVERASKLHDGIRARRDALESTTEGLSGMMSELDGVVTDLYDAAHRLSE